VTLWSVNLLDSCASSQTAATIYGPWRDLPRDLREPALVVTTRAGVGTLSIDLQTREAEQETRPLLEPYMLTAGSSVCVPLPDASAQARIVVSLHPDGRSWMSIAVARIQGDLP
jgi:hypothetical protein